MYLAVESICIVLQSLLEVELSLIHQNLEGVDVLKNYIYVHFYNYALKEENTLISHITVYNIFTHTIAMVVKD